MLADKAAFLSKAQAHKTRIANDNLLEPQQLLEIKRLSAGLTNDTAPSLDTVLGRMLPFNGIALPGVFQK